MSHWSHLKKLALVFIVSVAHITVLSGFHHFASGTHATKASPSAANLSITLRPAVNNLLVDALAKPPEQADKKNSDSVDSLTKTETHKSSLPATPFWSGLQSDAYFLDTDEVDEAAIPDDSFEARLAKLLPFDVRKVVLEFWIENDGRTVEVRCIGGACSSDVMGSLPTLTELAFTPAIKNGKAVANRKIIEVDLKLVYEF